MYDKSYYLKKSFVYLPHFLCSVRKKAKHLEDIFVTKSIHETLTYFSFSSQLKNNRKKLSGYVYFFLSFWAIFTFPNNNWILKK